MTDLDYAKELDEQRKIIQDLGEENKYLKSKLMNCECDTISCIDNTDYKQKYNKVKEQLYNAIKTIKYLSNLL